MYQPIQFKNTTILLALAILTILCANISFAQVDYSTLNYPGGAMGSSTFLTGIRGAGGENVYITGFYALAGETNGQGLFYQGLLDGSGDWTLLNFPSSPGVTVTSTTLYGPDALSSNNVRLVGSYKTQETGDFDHGLLYEGPTDGSGTWQTIDFPIAAATPSPSPGEQVLDTLAHSTMGGNTPSPAATVTQISRESTMATWWTGTRRHKRLRTGRPTTIRTATASASTSRISTALRATSTTAST